jgi:hypothetical protein
MIRDVHPGSGSRIRILTFTPSRIPDPGGQKGTGSRIRIRNIGFNLACLTILSGFREYVSNYTCQMEAMRFKLLEKKKGRIFFLLLL